MTAPDELERAVERLCRMRDDARDGTAITDPNEWEADELTDILAAFRLLLSERAELLATVERMRGALEEADRRLNRPDWTVQRDVTRGAIRAALTTEEATTPNAGERG